MKANFELDPVQWSRLRGLLDGALALAPTERTAWIERLGQEDEDLKPRLRALLAHAAGDSSPLDTLPHVETVQFLAERARRGDAVLAPGAAIGPYRLIRPLGEGGMGAVWLAERTDMLQRRQVALKLPRLLTQRAALAERLAREREILAALNHPNIARLYDAGLTADGQPYLALEYVEGERIDAHCTRKALDVPARLQLFLQVARAVAHAHAQLVVHRDLKPANILVTEAGEVKLLDFGIAKLLEDGHAQETELTQLAGRALTPDYAAPEQILGQPIGTAADVYALGVVLFELLAGARPYKLKRDSRAALEEAIVAAEPARPSAAASEPKLRKRLRGDLDTIVLKALKKVPSERYGTVEALAEDIERHLGRRPVRAQPDSRWYRASKFVARNTVAVSASAAVAAAVLGGAGVAVWQARIAIQEKQRAEEVKRFIAGVFRNADPYQRTGAKLSVEDLLRDALRRINRDLSGRPAMQVELLELVGASLGNMQATELAESALNEAAIIGAGELGSDHPLTLRARVTRLEVLRFLGRGKELRRELVDLLPRLRTAGADPADLVAALQMQAHNAIDEARFDAAIVAARESLDIGTRVLDDRNPQRAKAAITLALAYEYSQQPEQAKAAAEQALRLAQLAQKEGGSVTSTLIEAHHVLGRALSALGEFGPGIEHLRRATSESITHFGPEAIEVGFNLHNTAKFMAEAGDVKGVVESATAAEKIFAKHARQGTYFHPYARASLAMAYTEARRREDVVPTLRAALSELESVLGPAHPIIRNVREGLALALSFRGDAELARATLAEIKSDATSGSVWRTLRVRSIVERLDGKHEAAAKLAREGLARLSGPRVELHRMQLLPVLGLALLELSEGDEVMTVLTEALGLLERFETTPSPTRADVNVGLGRALLRSGATDKALVHFQQADAFWRGFDPDNRWAGEAAYWLARCYEALDRDEEAKRAYARAATILSRSPLPGDVRLAQLARARAPATRAGL